MQLSWLLGLQLAGNMLNTRKKLVKDKRPYIHSQSPDGARLTYDYDG